MGTDPAGSSHRLKVEGLQVVLPNGKVLIEDFSMEVAPGEVAVILGGSGAGKSTFSRVLFEREELEKAGFSLTTRHLDYQREHLGLVPQRGALFDHLDVRGNLDIAIRYARDTGTDHAPVETWLERVGLPARLADGSVAVGSLSGGQAQRVAVARVLAGKRQLLFLDEPSVGLDPHRVRMLARLIRQEVESLGLAAIVVTHDIALAAGVADRLYLLDTASRRLELLFEDEWPGPMEKPGIPAEVRGDWLVKLESVMVDRIDQGDSAPEMRAHPEHRPRRFTWLRERAAPLVAPFGVAMDAVRYAPRHFFSRPGDFLTVSRRVLVQTLFRPLIFYAIVSTLIGYTVLYVVSKVGGAGVRPDALLRQIGGGHIVALAPALSAILFVSASGSATNAWLGSMGLTKQVLAMEALGVKRQSYLWAPAWLTLGFSFMCVASLFALGMIAGGMILCAQYDLQGSWELLSGDILDPRPERARYAVRAAVLVWIYAWGIASDVVAKGGAPKTETDDVTRGMTASVVACTLWMVAWELATVMVVFS